MFDELLKPGNNYDNTVKLINGLRAIVRESPLDCEGKEGALTLTMLIEVYEQVHLNPHALMNFAARVGVLMPLTAEIAMMLKAIGDIK